MNKKASNGGPLFGLKVIEFEGIGPAPLAGQLLSDLGAERTHLIFWTEVKMYLP